MMTRGPQLDQYHDPDVDTKEKMTIDVDEAYNRIESMEAMLPTNADRKDMMKSEVRDSLAEKKRETVDLRNLDDPTLENTRHSVTRNSIRQAHWTN